MIKTGDKLWYVPSYRRGQGYEVVVCKVGRKLAEITGTRSKLNIETMKVVDKGNSYGSCYENEAAYLAECKRNLIESSFKREVSSSVRRNWTVEQMIHAAEILGLKVTQ